MSIGEAIAEGLAGTAQGLVKAGAVDVTAMVFATSLGLGITQTADEHNDPLRNNVIFWTGVVLLVVGVSAFAIRLIRFTFGR